MIGPRKAPRLPRRYQFPEDCEPVSGWVVAIWIIAGLVIYGLVWWARA